MSIVRYPSEFTAQAATDYIEIKSLVKTYAKNQPAETYKQLGNSIIMNVPQKVTEQFSQNWRNGTLGPEGAGLLSTTRPTGVNFLDLSRRLIENALLNQVTEELSKLGASSINENSILSATGGVIYNPMMEVLYDGPNFREFQFQFTLFAKSQKDANAIFNIVRFFQTCSTPSKTGVINSENLIVAITTAASSQTVGAIGTGIQNILSTAVGGVLGGSSSQSGNIATTINSLIGATATGIGGAASGTVLFTGQNRFITQPPFIQIKFKRGSKQHPYILPTKPCVITNLNIDYTPSGNYTVLNNFNETNVATVVATTISINLREIKTIFVEDYNNNGSDFDGIEFQSVAPPGPAGQLTSPAQTLIQPAGPGPTAPTLGLPGP